MALKLIQILSNFKRNCHFLTPGLLNIFFSLGESMDQSWEPPFTCCPAYSWMGGKIYPKNIWMMRMVIRGEYWWMALHYIVCGWSAVVCGSDLFLALWDKNGSKFSRWSSKSVLLMTLTKKETKMTKGNLYEWGEWGNHSVLIISYYGTMEILSLHITFYLGKIVCK